MRLPMVPPSCSLSDVERKEQLHRYRAAGEGSELIESATRRRVVRVSSSVAEALTGRLNHVEQSCCRFLEMSWNQVSRCLTISVPTDDQEPALDAIGYSLGVGEAAP